MTSTPGKRVTVNLSLRGEAALQFCQDRTGASGTETINDALRLYAMVLSKPDAQLMLQEPGGQVERILLP